ncbi:MAG: alpha/beta fold hydrolase [Pseudomonadota bacterium]|nr:alpha/beta fold hydrolase [Pseudomonadota bacterium]
MSKPTMRPDVPHQRKDQTVNKFIAPNRGLAQIMRRSALPLFGALALLFIGEATAQDTDKGNPYASIDVSDETLVRELGGFMNGYAQVKGTRLHYVEGGKGSLVVLIPGWPQTWWAFHKIMPALAKNHHVVAVDLRGMGTSDKPLDGYDKKNMARDIRELVKSLGHDKAHIVGHDIGGHVAYAYAAQFPDSALSMVYLDVSGLPASVADLKLVPEKKLSGPFTNNFFIWWFAMHQVNELPEQLIEGRAHIYLDWFWKSLLDERTGRVVNASMAEYHMPVHLDMPVIDVTWTDIPDPHAPTGARGIGEVSMNGASAALANAAYDATGRRIRELPITLDKLL